MMKTISLEIDELIFEETESILLSNRKPRNIYINEALSYYNNHIQKRILLEKALLQESRAVYASSMEVLKEFESIDNQSHKWLKYFASIGKKRNSKPTSEL